jgi:hypothetical protein
VKPCNGIALKEILGRILAKGGDREVPKKETGAVVAFRSIFEPSPTDVV